MSATVIFNGRLTTDPNQQQTNSGTEVANIRVAVNESRKDQSGNYPATFFNVSVWGKPAEFVMKFFHKGDPITVIGELTTREYQSQGQNRTSLDVNAWHVEFVPARSTYDGQGQPAQNAGYTNSPNQGFSTPQTNQWGNYNQPAQNGTGNQFSGNGVGSDPREPGTWGPNYVERAVDTENLPFGNQPQPQQSETEQTTLDDVPF